MLFFTKALLDQQRLALSATDPRLLADAHNIYGALSVDAHLHLDVFRIDILSLARSKHLEGENLFGLGIPRDALRVDYSGCNILQAVRHSGHNV